ncbi:MAG: hypothetical protein ACKVOK_02840 [Flavobacteriales bacterium]
MTTKKVSYLLIALFLFALNVSSQTDPPPPPMAMPPDSSVILVDKIIEITKHEKYFIDYCTKKVKNHSKENGWTQEKTDKILKSIKFEYYNSTIYNSYAFYSIDQLKSLLDALTLLNKDTKGGMPMILTNSMMQSNLELFADNVIKGEYVPTK